MFNPETAQTLPQEEGVSAPVAEAPAQIDTTQAAVSEAEGKPESLADFAMRLENMLPREGDSLPEGGMEALTGQWADQMDAMRQTEARESFQQVVASQRGMIQEELFREEIANGGSERKEGGESGFSQDQVAVEKFGASEWILEKLNHVPGGKKFLGALALIAGLSSIPKDAEAGWWGSIKEVVSQSAGQTVQDQIQIARQRRLTEEQRRQEEINYKRNRERQQAEQYESRSEQMKAEYNNSSKEEMRQFFGDSTRITSEFNNQEARIKAEYRQKKNQILQGNIKDETLKQEALRDANFAYNEDMMGAAGIAWNGLHQAQGRAEAYLRLVEEKFTFAGSTGITDHSQVNDSFIKDVQADIASIMKQSRANQETLDFLERLNEVCGRGELQNTIVSRITINSGNEGSARTTRGTPGSDAQPARTSRQQDISGGEDSGSNYSGFNARPQMMKKPSAPDYRSGQRSESNTPSTDYSLLSR